MTSEYFCCSTSLREDGFQDSLKHNRFTKPPSEIRVFRQVFFCSICVASSTRVVNEVLNQITHSLHRNSPVRIKQNLLSLKCETSAELQPILERWWIRRNFSLHYFERETLRNSKNWFFGLDQCCHFFLKKRDRVVSEKETIKRLLRHICWRKETKRPKESKNIQLRLNFFQENWMHQKLVRTWVKTAFDILKAG